MATSPLVPTLNGFVRTTLDAMILFEACLSGRINHVPRRPHDRERTDLIKSGNIFIYEEHASGIKRWTDSVSWSPSRILGNFLIYRELEKPFPPGEKKRALKKTKKPQGIAKPEQHRASISLPVRLDSNEGTLINEEDRAYVGSLVDSYPFKPEGLVKKTISITYQGVPHHLVSYYSVEDAKSGNLVTPSMHPQLRAIIPRQELITGQSFRAPLDESDGFPTPEQQHQRLGYYHMHNDQEYTLHGGAYRTMSVPNVPHVPSVLPAYQQFPSPQQYVPAPYAYPQQPQPQQPQHQQPQHQQHQQQQSQQEQHHHHQQQQQQDHSGYSNMWGYYYPPNGNM
ncbi:hypothetical protein FSARC_6629 [Fusarium sarcochroum]|uniref:Global transcription regulator sge1 n=1 Tax=Fusarium sarcochroum TaxID=1208366 RepID=A0A8H4X862_9HYPO|nr:hypothetical protein FSARC_6629 [Fusarium sarcochroum]